MSTKTETDFVALAETFWRGEADLMGRDHPVSGQYPGSQEIASDLLYFKGVAAISVIDTGVGLVMMDAGTRNDIDRVYEAVRAWRPDVPLVAAVFSQHHLDHIWATRRFEIEATEKGWPTPIVYAHKLLPLHFDRYRRTAGWTDSINARQFSRVLAVAERQTDYRYPDVTFEDHMTLKVGKYTFELHHARGETDDHVWGWVPERRWLFPGDLFIWAVPNAGNPQKVQRYCEEWATALRKMAGCGPEIMFCGHGVPIIGKDRIQQALLETAEYLESLEHQTLALMNMAVPLDDILQLVKPPAHLSDRPYLRPIYDHPQFLVRNIWRRYGGWWDGEADSLLPAPRKPQACEWIALAGGVEPVLSRVEQLVAEGKLQLASHLIEMAVLAEPDSKTAYELRKKIYTARADEEPSTMARGIFNHFAKSSRSQQRDALAFQGVAGALAKGTV